MVGTLTNLETLDKMWVHMNRTEKKKLRMTIYQIVLTMKNQAHIIFGGLMLHMYDPTACRECRLPSLLPNS